MNRDNISPYFSHQFSENYIWELSWSPDGEQFAIVDYTPVTTVWAAWNSVDELIAYAKECCVLRDLTPEERELFGLPPVGNATPGATPAPDESSGSGAGVRVALLAPLPVAALVIRSRRKKVM